MEPIFLAREISVKSKYNKRQNQYFVCLVTFMDLGHTGSHSFHRTQRMCGITFTKQATECWLLPSFYRSKRKNSALLKFLDVNRVNGFAIYWFAA